MEIILTIAGVVVILVVIMLVLNIRNIAGLRLKKPTIELRADTELPAYLDELFKPVEVRLQTLGFERLHCLYSDSFISHQMSGKWSVLFGNRKESAYAEVSMTSVQAEMPGYEVSFSTIFTDDYLLQTLNFRKHGIFVDIPKVIIIDPCTPDTEEQWQAHCKKSRELQLKQHPAPLWPLFYAARQQLAGEQMIEEAYAQGLLKETENSEFAFKLKHAIPFAWQLFKGQQKTAGLQKARKKLAIAANEAIPVEAEVDSFLRIESISRKKPIGRIGKTLILLISVMLFSISFGISMSFQSVLFLLGAVMLHEMGHFLGMYFCGYRNLQVLFVPFLGAVAYGAEQNTKPYQRVIVLLLGPLPGVVLGLTGFFLYTVLHAQWLYELSTMLLILNLFNLLPVMPLDGGQLVQTVLFQRFPRIQALFHVISTAIFAALALSTNDTVLRVISIFMCLAIPMQWRQGSALVRMKKGLTERIEDERRRLAYFFNVLRDKPFSRIPFPKKVMIVKTAERELRVTPASWRLIFVTLLLYGMTVLSPISIFFMDSPQRANSASSAADTLPKSSDWDVKIDQAATPDARFSLLLEAGEWCTEIDDINAAKKYFDKARELARTFGENDIKVAKSCIALASLENKEQAGPLLEQALNIQEKQLGSSHQDIAETILLLAQTRSGGAAIPLMERRLAILEKVKGVNSREVAFALHQMVSLYDSEHLDQDALRSAQRCQSLVRQIPANWSLSMLFKDLGVYHAVHGRFDEAEKLLQEGQERMKKEAAQSGGVLKEELGWVYLSQGKGAEAIRMVREAIDERRAIRKESLSYKKIGVLGYVVMTVMNRNARKSYSTETGASAMDIPLLLDLSAICLALGKTDEAKNYFEEAKRLEKAYGRKTGSSFLDGMKRFDLEETESTGFLQVWQKRKQSVREELKIKFQGNMSSWNVRINGEFYA